MDLKSFVLVLATDCPEVGGVAGDSVLIRPGTPDPVVVVHRPSHATYGELAALLAEGRADCPTLSASRALERLVSLARSAALPPLRELPSRVLPFQPRQGRSA